MNKHERREFEQWLAWTPWATPEEARAHGGDPAWCYMDRPPPNRVTRPVSSWEAVGDEGSVK